MKKYCFVFACIISICLLFVVGCNDSGVGPTVDDLPQANRVTKVRFVLGEESVRAAIMAQTSAPGVKLELVLLNPSDNTKPLIRFVKEAAVTSAGQNYTAEASFDNVPVLPALGKMIISGGKVPDPDDNQKTYSEWIGMQDLLEGEENTINLVGVGSKNITDISANLLQKLIEVPANVATLPAQILTRVREIVTNMNPTTDTSYDDAVTAFYNTYPLPAVPANPSAEAGDASVRISWTNSDGATSHNLYWSAASPVSKSSSKITGASNPYSHTGRTNGQKYYYAVAALNANGESALSSEVSATPVAPVQIDTDFPIPTGFTSTAFPVKTPTADLAISNFVTESEVCLIFMNRGDSSLTPSWSANRAAASVLRNFSVSATDASEPEISNEHRFHINLRNAEKKLPPFERTSANAISKSIRAQVADVQQFHYLNANNQSLTLTANYARTLDIDGSNKKLHFYVDQEISLDNSDLQTILNGLGTKWGSIYETDRRIFGDEPAGTVNGIDATDFTILISTKIYTIGYYFSGDLYTDGVAQQSGFRSNERKMFYLQFPSTAITDINRTIDDLSATMAHEFQHMIYFHIKGDKAETWLNEAMSGYAEHINGFTIENGKSQGKAIFVRDYLVKVNSSSLVTWQGTRENYGQVFLFGRWLGQNFGSAGSVRGLLASNSTGKNAVADFCNDSFDNVFAKFMVSIWANDHSGGVYGFSGLNLNATYEFGAGWAPITLSGPTTSTINFLSDTAGSQAIGSYCAHYVKVLNGNGGTLNVNATIPNGVALFQLKKN